MPAESTVMLAPEPAEPLIKTTPEVPLGERIRFSFAPVLSALIVTPEPAVVPRMPSRVCGVPVLWSVMTESAIDVLELALGITPVVKPLMPPPPVVGATW